MSNPNFEKPSFVTGIAVTAEYDVSPQAIEIYREEEHLSEDDYSDAEVADLICEDDYQYILSTSERVAESLKRLKRMADAELLRMYPEVDFAGVDSALEDWFVVKQFNAYSDDSTGFEICYNDEVMPDIFQEGDDLASVFWNTVSLAQAEEQGVTFEDVKDFFDTLKEAYNYIMVLVGYNFGLQRINGGTYKNVSPITSEPIPSPLFKLTSVIKAIDRNAEGVMAY